MRDAGISFDELRGVRGSKEEKPAKKYNVSGKKCNVDEFFNELLQIEENGIVTESAPKLAKRLSIGMSTVYLRLSKLVDDGRIVNLGKEGYQITQK